MNDQRAFVDALLDPAQPVPAGLVTWNGSDPLARFSVYRNNVIASLINALADTYPVTQELVGEEFFRAMARIFVHAEPPRSRVLAFYGASFPVFIAHFPPAQSVPYLADVARLEIARVRAYHAAECPALAAADIVQALTDPNQLPHLLAGFQPSMALVRSQYAVISLWAAHQGMANIETVDPHVAENALIIRPDLDVDVIRLTDGAGEFVEQLLGGADLGSAATQASLADPQFDLTGTVSLLMRTQAIISITARTNQP